jgi:hypothetical protein
LKKDAHFQDSAESWTVYVDEPDPQHRGIFREGQRVKLILKKRIYMLLEPAIEVGSAVLSQHQTISD